MTDNSSDMEKKLFQPSKSLQGQPGQDSSRGRQDGSGASQLSKNFPKSSSSASSAPRRRDSPNNHQQQQQYGIKTRSESTNPRKPNPQKSKAMDKRPRARSGFGNQPVVEEEEDSDKGPELGSLQTPGGKKQSLNHLLNFHFAPRETSGNGSVFQGSWRSYNSHPGGGWRSRHGSGGPCNNIRPKFNKENFLQANCQFLVKNNGDYSAHLYNPDMLVDWESIEEIYIRVAGEVPNCPICLSPPIAAKMTRCGHIFCWPCLLHYLALSDKKSRKCPICFEPVFKHELKSVVVTHCEEIHIGDEIEMQLMVRKKGVFKALPLMCKDDEKAFEWEPIFSKLLQASPAEVKVRVLDREKLELERRFNEDEHTPEVCFVEQAMRELDTRRSNTVDSTTTTQESKKVQVFGALNLDWNQEELQDQSELALSLAKTRSVDQLTAQREKIVKDSVGGDDDDGTVSQSIVGDDHFYFYQAVKGENIFLHPINMAMLWKSFGPNPSSWPQVIQFRVIDSDQITMMEELRKRLKFLQHLPLTTNVQLVEVDLRPPVVPQQVLQEFGLQLEARRKRRRQRARDERRRERKIEEEENKRLRGAKFELDYDFPEYHLEEEQLAALQLSQVESLEGALNVSTTDDETNSSADRNSNLDFGMSSSPNSMSFAQIVSQKNKSSSVRSGGWGRPPGAAAGGREIPSKTRLQSDSEAEPDEYSVPAFRMSVSDAIAKAFATADELEDAASNSRSGAAVGAGGAGAGGASKKKGRRKGKVLFTTGMGCMQ